jgi:3-phenylpropionate/trans-cinnamate dioxygenase ferredoxin reductase subunit
MTPEETYVIVGASATGGTAAEALRRSGFTGRIVLVGAEPDRPYERPPLSKQYLQGTYPEEKVFFRPDAYYADQAIDLRLGVRATALDPASQTVTLDAGESLRYDKLLIATGSQLRHLSLPGGDLDGVFYLRTLQDARLLAAQLQRINRVVVIGAGFIGSEVAASARTIGREVTVLEGAPVPLERALGTQMGEVCADIHRDHGVEIRTSAKVQEFRGGKQVEQVVLAGGETIPCDAVVVGVGVMPVVDWLAGSGVAIDNGVVVNEYAEASVSNVYAAGDVASWWHPVLEERLRVEHFDHARNHGLAVGKVMAGKREPYIQVPYFWSDQYEFKLQYVGHASGDTPVVIRGDVPARSFTAFYVAEGRVRAALSIGRPGDVMGARRLIAARQAVAPEVLMDDQADLRTLVA